MARTHTHTLYQSRWQNIRFISASVRKLFPCEAWLHSALVALHQKHTYFGLFCIGPILFGQYIQTDLWHWYHLPNKPINCFFFHSLFVYVRFFGFRALHSSHIHQWKHTQNWPRLFSDRCELIAIGNNCLCSAVCDCLWFWIDSCWSNLRQIRLNAIIVCMVEAILSVGKLDEYFVDFHFKCRLVLEISFHNSSFSFFSTLKQSFHRSCCVVLKWTVSPRLFFVSECYHVDDGSITVHFFSSIFFFFYHAHKCQRNTASENKRFFCFS